MRVSRRSSGLPLLQNQTFHCFEISDEWIEKCVLSCQVSKRSGLAMWQSLVCLFMMPTNWQRRKLLLTSLKRRPALGGDAKQVSNWSQGKSHNSWTQKAKRWKEIQLTPENLVEVIAIIEDGTISSKIAKKVFVHLAKNGGGARGNTSKKAGLVQISDPEVLIPIIHQSSQRSSRCWLQVRKRNADKAFLTSLWESNQRPNQPTSSPQVTCPELAKLKED